MFSIPILNIFKEFCLSRVVSRTSATHSKKVATSGNPPYGHAWIILEDAVWLTKNGVTDTVPIPRKPAAFSGTTSAEKFIYKAALKNTLTTGSIQMVLSK
jgi:hypothetical protein